MLILLSLLKKRWFINIFLLLFLFPSVSLSGSLGDKYKKEADVGNCSREQASHAKFNSWNEDLVDAYGCLVGNKLYQVDSNGNALSEVLILNEQKKTIEENYQSYYWKLTEISKDDKGRIVRYTCNLSNQYSNDCSTKITSTILFDLAKDIKDIDYYALGNKKAAEKDWKGAKDAFLVANNRFPKDAAVSHVLGYIYEQLFIEGNQKDFGLEQKSIDFYEESAVNDSDNGKYHYFTAVAMILSQDRARNYSSSICYYLERARDLNYMVAEVDKWYKEDWNYFDPSFYDPTTDVNNPYYVHCQPPS